MIKQGKTVARNRQTTGLEGRALTVHPETPPYNVSKAGEGRGARRFRATNCATSKGCALSAHLLIRLRFPGLPPQRAQGLRKRAAALGRRNSSFRLHAGPGGDGAELLHPLAPTRRCRAKRMERRIFGPRATSSGDPGRRFSRMGGIRTTRRAFAKFAKPEGHSLCHNLMRVKPSGNCGDETIGAWERRGRRSASNEKPRLARQMKGRGKRAM